MKIYVKATEVPSITYYRAVPKGKDPLSFRWYELGIHCGSLGQAQYFAENRDCDIYEIKLNPGVKFSNPISDFEEWTSVECLDEILNVGFDISISRAQIIKDLRDKIWTKETAADYIINEVGSPAVVKYNNEIELNEEDIIILDKSIIKSVEKV